MLNKIKVKLNKIKNKIKVKLNKIKVYKKSESFLEFQQEDKLQKIKIDLIFEILFFIQTVLFDFIK